MAKKKVARRPYTEQDDHVILEMLSTYPGNLNLAFEQAGLKLNRTTGAVSGHYYSNLKTNPTNKPALGLITRHGTMMNTKNTRRPEQLKQRGLSAFEVAATIVDTLTPEEKTKLILSMINKK